jgi:hypothetical protein
MLFGPPGRCGADLRGRIERGEFHRGSIFMVGRK